VYVHIYIYIYVCIYTCKYTHMYIYIYEQFQTHAYMGIYICMFINIRVYMHICKYTHIYIYTCIFTAPHGHASNVQRTLRFKSHINESRMSESHSRLWMSRVTHERACLIWLSQVTYKWVMSRMKELYCIWMGHVIYEWVMLHINESCPI